MWRTQATSLALVAAMWLIGCADAGWPLCKQRCDSSYNKEQLLEHPGVASVCHRGCEFFTVALIASPHGGLPLMERKLTWTQDPINVNLQPKLATLLKGSSKNKELKIIEGKQPQKEESGKLGNIPDHEKKDGGKENDKLGEKQPAKKLENVKTSKKERMADIKKQKKSDKEKKITVDIQSAHSTVAKKAPNEVSNAPKFIMSHEKLKGHQQHIQFITPFSPPYSSALKQGILKIPIKIMEGAPAKQILAEAREAEEPVMIETSKPYGPVHISSQTLTPEKQPALEDKDANKKGEEAKETQSKMVLQTKESKKAPKTKETQKVPQTKETQKVPLTKKTQSKKEPHGPVSKTTMQPASHPVQDHPVHASRQITTDSSGADERKPTTPQSSNPSLPVDHKNPEFDAFAKLANKLGSSVKKDMHPLIRLSIDEPKTIGIFPAPQQISIIEIIKKKNNIDFEKLHQEHMSDAIHCPMIFERFEEAKHSCRQACTKAYTSPKERDACVAGCHLQASSSSDQVRSQLAEPALVGPEGIFSAVRQMFSNFASHIGQSLRSAWSVVTNSRKENTGFGPGPEIPIPRGFGAPELKSSELKQPSHVGLEVFIEKSGPRTVQKKTVIGPKGRVINMETIVQVTGHSSPMTPGQMLHQQLENHKKMMHQEMEVQGKLLAEDPSNIEIELNRQLEVMGKHLTEDAKNVGGEHPFFQPFFSQFLFPKVSSKNGLELQPSEEAAAANLEKQESSLFENLFPFPSSFTGILRKEEKKDNDLETDDLLFRTNSVKKNEVKLLDNLNGDNPDEKPDSHRDAATRDNIPAQQLDLLDCISRKSGLPHWLIVFSLYTSVLVVFWLCFLLYAYVVELRECKNKAPTMICEAGEPLLDDCCEIKKLLPAEECFEIRVKTV